MPNSQMTTAVPAVLPHCCDCSKRYRKSALARHRRFFFLAAPHRMPAVSAQQRLVHHLATEDELDLQPATTTTAAALAASRSIPASQPATLAATVAVAVALRPTASARGDAASSRAHVLAQARRTVAATTTDAAVVPTSPPANLAAAAAVAVAL